MFQTCTFIPVQVFLNCLDFLTQVFGFQEQRVKPMGDDLLTEKGPNRYYDHQVTQQRSSSLHIYMYMCSIVQLYLYVAFGIFSCCKISLLYPSNIYYISQYLRRDTCKLKF